MKEVSSYDITNYYNDYVKELKLPLIFTDSFHQIQIYTIPFPSGTAFIANIQSPYLSGALRFR